MNGLLREEDIEFFVAYLLLLMSELKVDKLSQYKKYWTKHNKTDLIHGMPECIIMYLMLICLHVLLQQKHSPTDGEEQVHLTRVYQWC